MMKLKNHHKQKIEYDLYDVKFIEIIEMIFNEDEEFEYFHRFELLKKKKHIETLKIFQTNKSNIPLRFKIIEF